MWMMMHQRRIERKKEKNNDNKGEEWSITIVATAHGDYPLLFATLLYSNNAATANNKAGVTAIQEGQEG